jgi:uncharacterized protein YbjT (DUF2867 family)
MNKRIVSIVTGSSNSGKSCIEELLTKFSDKVSVRGAFRTEEKAKPFREKYPNLEVVTGIDANQPETLTAAYKNVHAALVVTTHDSTRGFDDDAQLTANLINSAVDNGVKYIVLVASFTVHSEKMSLLASRFDPSEKLLEKLEKERGIQWSVLRGGFFMENTTYMFKDSIQNKNEIRLPEFVYPMVDTRDIGK